VNDPSQLLDLMPFAGKLGAELALATAESVAGRLDWASDFCTSGGVLDGGGGGFQFSWSSQRDRRDLAATEVPSCTRTSGSICRASQRHSYRPGVLTGEQRN
jgi:hypothetical protein